MNEIEKAVKTIKIAIAEVEWNYPLDYAIAFETAIEALQEKAERTPATVVSSEDDFYHFCSECNNEVYKKDKYCHTCGRELKWRKNNVEL